MIKKTLGILSIAGLVGSALPAYAGTKVAMSLVSTSLANPTLTSNKGSVKLGDSGKVSAGLKGVTDGGGALVTTTTSFVDSGTLDGSEYIVIIKGAFTGLATPFEVVVPIDLSDGKGKAKLDLSSAFTLIPMGTLRSVEIAGAEVWGPLGAGNVAGCQAIVSNMLAPRVTLVPDDPSCRGGVKIGTSGLDVPLP